MRSVLLCDPRRSWFTLKYAEALYKLACPLQFQKAEKMDKVVKAAGAAAIAAQQDFSKQHEPKSVRPALGAPRAASLAGGVAAVAPRPPPCGHAAHSSTRCAQARCPG